MQFHTQNKLHTYFTCKLYTAVYAVYSLLHVQHTLFKKDNPPSRLVSIT